jgi:hypothetical protein
MTDTRTYHLLTPETFSTVLAIGSRVETWDGIWGTVTAIEDLDTWGHIVDKNVTIHADHTPSFDSVGWPTDGGPMDITRVVRKYSSDLRHISTGEAA